MHGPDIDEPVVWYEGAGTTDRRWLAADQLGSVIAVTNGAGAASAINRYDAYGVPGTTNAGRFQFTGQAWLPEVSLYHYKARAYSPATGRFLQTDPILFDGGMNLYAYVENDPLNFVDSNGLERRCYRIDLGEIVRTISEEEIEITARYGEFCSNVEMDAEFGQGHDYTVTSLVCDVALSPEQQAQILPRFAYPGQNPNKPIPTNRRSLQFVTDRTMGGMPGGFVWSVPSDDGRTNTNITTDLHLLRGTIRRAMFTSGGRTYITTHGQGMHFGFNLGGIFHIPGAPIDAINQVQGSRIFNHADATAAAYLDETISGC